MILKDSNGAGALLVESYLLDTWLLIQMLSSGRWIDDEHRSSMTVINALKGLIVFGYPGFMYAFFGRFTWRAESLSVDSSSNSLSDLDETIPVSNAR